MQRLIRDHLFGGKNSNKDIYLKVHGSRALWKECLVCFEKMEKALIICKNLGLSLYSDIESCVN